MKLCEGILPGSWQCFKLSLLFCYFVRLPKPKLGRGLSLAVVLRNKDLMPTPETVFLDRSGEVENPTSTQIWDFVVLYHLGRL